MTTLVQDADAVVRRCHEAARHEGLAPALAVLADSVLPGLLPCGPGGHAVVAARTHHAAHTLWLDGARRPVEAGRAVVRAELALPGGPVVLLDTGQRAPADRGGRVAAEQRELYGLGLVWLRLGLAEALRAACVTRLAGRRVGDTTLLQQQLVKGAVADVLAEHLEIRAVLDGARPGARSAGMLQHLHGRITAADREQVRLLGAAGYLTDSPGMTAYASELLAEVHAVAQEAS
uniref:Acyl-CoA dehydrogenase n=1 Tax=Streptomyces sp. NBC_00003 TaxID=2903608 RepID=A0AAU2V2W0_9ACTN